MDELRKDDTTNKYFNLLTRRITNSFSKNILNDIKKLNINSILDVGCGTGYLTNKIYSIVPNVIGCDIDSKRLQLAKEYAAGKIKFIQNMSTTLPFPDRSFDLVTCFEVLEHVSNYSDLVKECKRVSKKYVMFTVPNEPYFRLANLLRLKYISRFGNHPEHINHFNKHKFKLTLSKNLNVKRVKLNSFLWVSAICEI